MKYLAALLLLLQLNLSAQGLTGHVFDGTDKYPLNFVTIKVEEDNSATTTDENGYFQFKNNYADDQILVFTHLGYITKEISVKEFRAAFYTAFLESKLIISQTILVKGNIGTAGITPLTFTKTDRSSIKQTYISQDIPELLSYQPSITFYSENGNGLGYNYLSIRGFDQRRISVSINGIPQNDPEDHNVYWLDFPDLLESTELIQVQRGAGSGLAGYPAVGGSINIITSSFSDRPKINFSTSTGSYNTRKYSAQFSSGLISNKYSFYMKLSQTLSSGYRNSSWIDFKSIHLSAARYDANSTTQFNFYGGPVADGLAYTGLPKFAVKKRDLRKANYSYWEADNSGYTYNLERNPEELENFSQPHFELLNEIKISEKITLNNALFFVAGEGFFDYDGSWADTNYLRISGEFGYNPVANPGNSLIRAMVKNRQWGWIPRISIKHAGGELILGGEFRSHRSLHWGGINFGENLPPGVTKGYHYYQYEGGNDIATFYAHDNFRLNEKISFLLEGQLAYHQYRLFAEKFLGNEFKIGNLFLNPRIGMNYKFNPEWNIYLSFAQVSREPRLTNYYDAAESSGGAVPQFELDAAGNYDFNKPLVKPETMNNFELGSSLNKDDFNLSLNLFYMIFNNEIVKKGQIDRFGQPVTGNMDQTIHYGIETAGLFKVSGSLDLIINASFSRNYIRNGYAFLEGSGSSLPLIIDLENNRLSGFPDFTFNFISKYHCDNIFLQASLKYVGDFYTDNYDKNLSALVKSDPSIADYTDNKVDAYLVANIFASYTFPFEPIAKELRLFVQVNNLFDNLYASYGIGKEFFPAAERNIIFGINLGM